ncbi:MAG TPA: hypothetical protein HPP87_14015 [Planctomycetes bacterium]|nr:hypothetical protein [Planctomycetota bacterium]
MKAKIFNAQNAVNFEVEDVQRLWCGDVGKNTPEFSLVVVPNKLIIGLNMVD